MKTLMIGVAGGTGSGKTTLTRRLAERFGDDLCVIYHDNYYRAHNDLNYEERCRLNYDHPEAFETERLVKDLEQLRLGNAIRCPVYDFTIHNRSETAILVPPTPVIVIDGILILEDPALRAMLDIKVFVDTDADVRILRRIERDINERGRSLVSIREQYLNTVKPMHEQFVEPSRKYADIIIPEGGHNTVALAMLFLRIRAFIEEAEEIVE
ncbi:MAG: uridine kinase [Negativicutes bacterium]|nr:uridine kinase [Negativicutes bacterium]